MSRRWPVSFTDTTRGGAISESEQLATAMRQIDESGRPNQWASSALITPPCETIKTSSPFGWAAAIRSTARSTRACTSARGSPPGGSPWTGSRTHRV
jgi:hypothetical protein